ncbi:MAG: substrate-binding periplasmic protein [Actinomycetota bacterium]
MIDLHASKRRHARRDPAKKLGLGLLAIACLLAACVPPEPEEDLIRDFDPETTVMGAIQRAGLLRVGVPNNEALYRETGEEDQGLAADLAREIADTLGVETDFTVAANDTLVQMVKDDEIDVAFPVVPVVEKLVRTSGVSDPYFIAHQRLLVPGGAEARSLEELDGEICVFGDPETTIGPSTVAPDLEVTEADDASDCYETGGVFDDQTLAPPAMTGLDLALVGAALDLQGMCPPEARCLPPEVVGPGLTTAGISMVVEPGASGWVGFVDNVLADFKSDGLWLESYNTSLESYLGPQRAPEITVEEAAALYPREL